MDGDLIGKDWFKNQMERLTDLTEVRLNTEKTEYCKRFWEFLAALNWSLTTSNSWVKSFIVSSKMHGFYNEAPLFLLNDAPLPFPSRSKHTDI